MISCVFSFIFLNRTSTEQCPDRSWSIINLAPKPPYRSQWPSWFRRQPRIPRSFPFFLRSFDRERESGNKNRFLPYIRALFSRPLARRLSLRRSGTVLTALRRRLLLRASRASIKNRSGIGRKRRLIRVPENAAMSSISQSWSASGGRRKKVYEYLKAANELRQTYTAQIGNSLRELSGDDYYDVPGAYPDADTARSGERELVLFPSYARRIIRRQKNQCDADWEAYRYQDGWSQGLDEDETSYVRQGELGDTEYGSGDGRADGPEDVDENAIVDVDVHGWIYMPHRGPMGRKNRLMVALARKLTGIPAPNGNNAAESTDKVSGAREEEDVNKEAQLILNEANKETESTWKGGSSEDRDDKIPGPFLRRSTTSSQSLQMSNDELVTANANLMSRLRPFLAQPMPYTPVSVFFYNDEQSQSRNVLTDESGHFTVRAGLHFVPTHMRVLASENLSTSREIKVIEPAGVSLISDIDDTVKHSGIISGAKEVCRNTFVRDFADLTVSGVGQWYKRLFSMGVQIHYVSNSPWQLYSVLEQFFKVAGLPPGSFQLKHYSGMLQGIFESAAEKKRASLEKILRDFPSRKFILVGDSGEADLEVYTDLAMMHPGRVLGIFIRDVTTLEQKRFFEKSVDHPQTAPFRSESTGHLVNDPSLSTEKEKEKEKRPALPPRRPREPPSSAQSLDNGDLIDLWDEGDQQSRRNKPGEPAKRDNNRPPPPTKPFKPSSLRTVTAVSDTEKNVSTQSAQNQNAIRRKPAPPVPPRRISSAVSDRDSRLSDATLSGSSTASGKSSVASGPSSSADTFPIRIRQQSSEPWRNGAPPPVPPPRRTTMAAASMSDSGVNPTRPSPQVSQKQAYPLQCGSERPSSSPSPSPSPSPRPSVSNPSLYRTNTSGSSFSSDDPFSTPTPTPNKREEVWRRRWERAKELLDEQGVVLGSWRVGSDVQDVCVWLAQEALADVNNSPPGLPKRPVPSRTSTSSGQRE